tara:strand:- start:1348 stop:1926 length:579 start_codon:yes stop_codon:yes gene_type:complete
VIILGLTGGIATGKTTVSRMFARHNVPIFDADLTVHHLLQHECFYEVSDAFPEAVKNNHIDRKLLGARVFQDAAALRQLENMLHPAVRAKEHAFIRQQRRNHRRLILLDIPLLFETGADALCDYTITTYCPTFIQWQRAMRRPGMSEKKLSGILSKQMGHALRIHRSDFVIPTHQGKGVTIREVKRVLTSIG